MISESTGTNTTRLMKQFSDLFDLTIDVNSNKLSELYINTTWTQVALIPIAGHSIVLLHVSGDKFYAGWPAFASSIETIALHECAGPYIRTHAERWSLMNYLGG